MNEREFEIAISELAARVRDREEMVAALQMANSRLLERARKAEVLLAQRIMTAKSVREVLQPFARVAVGMPHVKDPGMPVNVTILFEHFLKARDFLVEAD